MLDLRTLFQVLAVGSVLFWIACRVGSPEMDQKLMIALAAYWLGVGTNLAGLKRSSDRDKPIVGNWGKLAIESIPLAALFAAAYCSMDGVNHRLTVANAGVDCVLAMVGGLAFCATRYTFAKKTTESAAS